MPPTFALDDLIPGVTQRLHAQQVNPEAYGRRAQFPRGIMGHYDGSLGADKWAVGWFRDPKCSVGYDLLALDDGGLVLVHDDIQHTYAAHAGPCLAEPGIPSYRETWPDGKVYTIGRGNPGYFAVSATTGPGTPATEPQVATIVRACAALYRFGMAAAGWTLAELPSRFVTHQSRAIWTPKYTSDRSRWGLVADARGRTRKDDPTGPDPARPVLDWASVARQVAGLLTPPPTIVPHAGDGVTVMHGPPPGADPFRFFSGPLSAFGDVAPSPLPFPHSRQDPTP